MYIHIYTHVLCIKEAHKDLNTAQISTGIYINTIMNSLPYNPLPQQNWLMDQFQNF